MIALSNCFKYEPKISRLTSANSIIVGSRVIYITKKDHTGKTTSSFIAYDYETKIQLAWHKNKDDLIAYLNKKEKEINELVL